jgi:hypothetical protein
VTRLNSKVTQFQCLYIVGNSLDLPLSAFKSRGICQDHFKREHFVNDTKHRLVSLAVPIPCASVGQGKDPKNGTVSEDNNLRPMIYIRDDLFMKDKIMLRLFKNNNTLTKQQLHWLDQILERSVNKETKKENYFMGPGNNSDFDSDLSDVEYSWRGSKTIRSYSKKPQNQIEESEQSHYAQSEYQWLRNKPLRSYSRKPRNRNENKMNVDKLVDNWHQNEPAKSYSRKTRHKSETELEEGIKVEMEDDKNSKLIFSCEEIKVNDTCANDINELPSSKRIKRKRYKFNSFRHYVWTPETANFFCYINKSRAKIFKLRYQLKRYHQELRKLKQGKICKEVCYNMSSTTETSKQH